MRVIICFCITFPFSVMAFSEAEQDAYVSTHEKYMQADKELNDIYNKQIAQFKKEGGDFYGQDLSRDKFLKKLQLAWITMRNASCDYETYEARKGTGFSTIYEKCLLDKTKLQIKYLKENE